jgi:hypothetical protein
MLSAAWSILLQVFVHQGLQIIVAGYVEEEGKGGNKAFPDMGVLTTYDQIESLYLIF